MEQGAQAVKSATADCSDGFVIRVLSCSLLQSSEHPAFGPRAGSRGRTEVCTEPLCSDPTRIEQDRRPCKRSVTPVARGKTCRGVSNTPSGMLAHELLWKPVRRIAAASATSNLERRRQ